MKGIIKVCAFLLFCNHLTAQHKVRFIVLENSFRRHDSIYITGAFNNWDPGDRKFLLQRMDSAHKSIVLSLPEGNFEYKFTRGDWPMVEKGNSCDEVENRIAGIHRDTTISLTIAKWMDECTSEGLRKTLPYLLEDSNKLNTLLMLCSYTINDQDSAMAYAKQALSLSKKIKNQKGEGAAYVRMGDVFSAYRKYPEARNFYLSAIRIQDELDEKTLVAQSYLSIANTYMAEENYPDWLQNSFSAIKYFEISGDKLGKAVTYSSIGAYYNTLGNTTDALKYFELCLGLFEGIKSGNGTWGVAMSSENLAEVHTKLGNYQEALKKDSVALRIFRELKLTANVAITLISIGNIFEKQGDDASAVGDMTVSGRKYREALEEYQESLKLNDEVGYVDNIASSYMSLGRINMKLRNLSAAEKYLEKGLEISREINSKSGLMDSYLSLAGLDSLRGDFKQAFGHYKKYIFYRDSLFSEANGRKAVQARMQYEFDKKEAIAKADQGKKDSEVLRIRNMQYFAIAGLGILVMAVLVIAFIQWRNGKQRQVANDLLSRQKEKVELTLSQLKATQSQLIQSEKMASLGELTAGIAHEIQNPLNFVNNFSDINKELIAEADGELEKGDIPEARQILADLRENEDKISHHGRRADAIVKSMLQHSRTSSGQKEPTDLNALADEYLKLAYHGLRAKDKDFNVTLETDFDPDLPKVNVIPQDIGRVLLNLYNNAFHAVQERMRKGEPGYDPKVKVEVKGILTAEAQKRRGIAESAVDPGSGILDPGLVRISVSDNGSGISAAIRDKIFQPFFTTKPTGQGTGLGLSLSYDIITKGHGGSLVLSDDVTSGTVFRIDLPA